jgi:hypothetical protein
MGSVSLNGTFSSKLTDKSNLFGSVVTATVGKRAIGSQMSIDTNLGSAKLTLMV